MSEKDLPLVEYEEQLAAANEPDPYDEALERMEPLDAAAHRSAKVIGCLGVLFGLGGGVAGGLMAGLKFGADAVGWGILGGSALPFLATALLEGNRRFAIRRARQKRMSVGTHAALPALEADNLDDEA